LRVSFSARPILAALLMLPLSGRYADDHAETRAVTEAVES